MCDPGIIAIKAIPAKNGKLAYYGNMTKRDILEALRRNEPFKGPPNIRTANFQLEESGEAAPPR